MTNSNYTDSQLQQAYQKAFKTYIGRNNVTGIDIGYQYTEGKRTDNIVVRIHVREKIPESSLETVEIFPKEIDGVTVDIIQAIYRSHSATESLFERKTRRDVLQPGISIGHPNISAGTFGAVVYDKLTGRSCILSNWHVMVGSRQAYPGDSILQPGAIDGGRVSRDQIGQLERSILNADGDAAIAFIDMNRPVKSAQMDTGVVVTTARQAQIGEIVEKSGRTTGVTRGKVDGWGAYQITYSIGERTIEGFKVVSIIDGNPNNEEISSGGDSGAIWYNPETQEGVGLHFAGEIDPNPRAEYAIACHLPRVLSALNASLTPIEKPGNIINQLESADDISTNIKKIIDEIKQMIGYVEMVAVLPVGTPIDQQIFRQFERKLKNIEFRMQFELLSAEDQNNWTLADLLYDAIEQCQSALNYVRSSLIRINLTRSDHEQIIAEFRKIKQEIDSAIKAQQVFDIVVRIAVLVRRFIVV